MGGRHWFSVNFMRKTVISNYDKFDPYGVQILASAAGLAING